MAVLLLAVYVAFSALDFSQDLVGVDFQGSVIFYQVELVSLHFVLHHHLDHFLWAVYDLLEGHVYVNFLQDVRLIVDFLDVLQVGHDRFVVDWKGNVLNVDQYLVYGSIMLPSYFDLLHNCINQDLIHLLCFDMKLILLVVKLIKNRLQIPYRRISRRKVCIQAIIKNIFATLLSIGKYGLIQRHYFPENKPSFFYLLTFKIHLKQLRFSVPQKLP